MTQIGMNKEFIDRIIDLTSRELKQKPIESLMGYVLEELGEFAAARAVERGDKNKELKESSLEESVDVVICALSLFYASGGTDDFLIEYGLKKLDKWETRI